MRSTELLINKNGMMNKFKICKMNRHSEGLCLNVLE